MIYKHSQKTKQVRGLFTAALVLACAFGTTNHAAAQKVTPPPTPTNITPEAGNTAFLVGHARGTQGYTCLPTSTGGTSWTVTPPRPEATLFTNFFGKDFQIITHFLSLDENPNDFGQGRVLPGGNATWQSSFDTSKVWAAAVGSIPPGSDRASCPNSRAIACLLLKSIGNQTGTTGGGLLDKVTFVQRLNTAGGVAPTTSCTVGQTFLSPYSADYYFFHRDR